MRSSVFSSEVGALLWKELRQIRRSRGAIFTSLLPPFLLLILVPFQQYNSLVAGRSTQAAGGLSQLGTGGPGALFRGLLLPLFVTMAGVLVAPSIASYAVVAERERRALDLLISLPVTVAQILAARVGAVLVICTAVTLPLFVVQQAY